MSAQRFNEFVEKCPNLHISMYPPNFSQQFLAPEASRFVPNKIYRDFSTASNARISCPLGCQLHPFDGRCWEWHKLRYETQLILAMAGRKCGHQINN
ncbi:MAG: hypothetical protein HQM08_12865 [Candidatus Riflebacteria bacterium]|nr:hypothetical protein [Candidatus Riflebacteria bacterium]